MGESKYMTEYRRGPRLGKVTRSKLTPLALRLRRARLNTHYHGEPISQALVGKAIGVTGHHISRWERGYAVPSEKYLKRLATFLGMTEDQVWLDAWMIPPDIKTFLLTTNEGEKVIGNIRTVMEMMEEEVGAYKKPTRKAIPEDQVIKISKSYMSTIERHIRDRDERVADAAKRSAQTRWGKDEEKT
jgi:transcriptional regulator with XRE-family HTH domain